MKFTKDMTLAELVEEGFEVTVTKFDVNRQSAHATMKEFIDGGVIGKEDVSEIYVEAEHTSDIKDFSYLTNSNKDEINVEVVLYLEGEVDDVDGLSDDNTEDISG